MLTAKTAPQEIQIQESQFQQTLVNLLRNSIEAIDEHMQSDGLNETPRIEIKAYTDEDFLYLDITDNGIGIIEQNLKLIFTAGYTTKESGTGLGLHSSANFVIGSWRENLLLERRHRQRHNHANHAAVLLCYTVKGHLFSFGNSLLP